MDLFVCGHMIAQGGLHAAGKLGRVAWIRPSSSRSSGRSWCSPPSSAGSGTTTARSSSTCAAAALRQWPRHDGCSVGRAPLAASLGADATATSHPGAVPVVADLGRRRQVWARCRARMGKRWA